MLDCALLVYACMYVRISGFSSHIRLSVVIGIAYWDIFLDFAVVENLGLPLEF